ncbi:uncharacterized protein LOC125289246 isoform X2 [Alosa alosa]|uniref:uncharacterized protein LOC125289246 isoform X2 n=1 Tax=Alosa alosa TaxID=278164 RepID=UPI0020151CAF|nr:uncharacterized protein LOC125289246 isoform X2 [Alosa alosa]
MTLISKGKPSLGEVKECSKDMVCITQTTGLYFVDNPNSEHVWRDCGPKIVSCVPWSWSNGMRTVTGNTSCCETELCNNKNDSLPAKIPLGDPNGRKCYTCVEKGCTSQMECFADQTHCLTVDNQKGCATESACNLLSAQSFAKMSCCNSTDLCNSVNDITQNLLPLILMSLGLISYLF